MAHQVGEVFEELGIAQYLGTFLDQGFDSWETILDITESDLDALGVKLGHRRKLQRRIANFRGVSADVALASPTRTTNSDDAGRPDTAPKQDAPNLNIDSRGAVPGVLAKRKYRRHPKPDDSAPERPPSAYVLFSNKMREELKGRSLSFTEIAKLVGENWQSLSPAEREPFETQAQVAKDRYNHDLAEYKKTPEYKKYMLYLQEFKAKHASQTQGVSYFFPATDKDAFKRIKLSEFGNSPSQASSTGSPSSQPSSVQHHRADSVAASGSGSSSESQHDRDTPQPSSRRDHRAGSPVSTSESQYSSTSPTPGGNQSASYDGILPSHGHALDDHQDRSPPHMSMSPQDVMSGTSSRRNSLWMSDSHPSRPPPPPVADVPAAGANHVSLPPLSDMFDSRRLVPTGPPIATKPDGTSSYGNGSAKASSSSSTPSGSGPESRPPLLRKEYSSSNTSTSTGSLSSYGHARTPLEGSLPIHALLSGKPTSPSPSSPLPPVSAAPHYPYHQPPPLAHTAHTAHTAHSPHPPPAPTAQAHVRASLSPERMRSPPQRSYSTLSDDHRPLYKDRSIGNSLHSNGGGYLSSAALATPIHAQIKSAGSPPLAVAPVAPAAPPLSTGALGLDGMTALVEAGEIVDRQV